MSGPKTNRINVEAMIRARLQSIRESLNVAVNDSTNALGRLKRQGMTNALFAQDEELAKQIEMLTQEALASIASLAAITLDRNLDQAQEKVDQTKNMIDAIFNETNAKLSDLVKRAEKEAAEKRNAQIDLEFATALKEQTSEHADDLRSDLDALSQLAQTIAQANAQRVDSAQLANSNATGDTSKFAARALEANEASERLFALLVNEALPEEERRMVSGFIADLTKLTDASSDQLESYCKQLSEIVPKFETKAERASQLIEEIATSTQTLQAHGIHAQEPTEFSTIEAIDSYLASLRSRINELDKQEYILACVDELMRRHGYDIANSVTLENTTEGARFLFTSDEDSDLNEGIFASFYGDDNLMLQVVGLSDGLQEEISAANSADREAIAAPLEKSRVQALNEDALLQMQIDFCSIYAELADELTEMGVTFETIKENEPDRRWCEQISLAGEETTSSEQPAQQSVNRALEQEKRRGQTAAAMKAK